MKPCQSCNGAGWMEEYRDGIRCGVRCPACIGRGQLPTTPAERRKWESVIRSELLTSTLQPPPTLIVVTLPPREGTP